MARMARAVAPGFPHHITQRGNRRQQTFFSDQDFKAYLALMAEWCENYRVEIWAYCLMPNHIHLIAVPDTKDGLNLAVGEAHRRYTRMINFREGCISGDSIRIN
nr:transposase [uncultured Desulfobacter sp.]